jgi:DNA polymerase-3 subunit alpha
MGSLLDGFSTPQEAVDRAVSINHSAIAITDHGTLSATLQFHNYAKDKGIKPIIGIEAYICEDINQKEKTSQNFHVVLLAQNQIGLKNLYVMSDIGWNQGFYRRPRIDPSVLNDYNEGIVCLSACMNGFVAQAILDGNKSEAVRRNEIYKDIFGDRYFVELQPWNDPELNKGLIEIAGEIPMVVTTDAHYAEQENKLAEEVSLIIAQSSSFGQKHKKILQEKFKESRNISNDLNRINYLHPDRKLRYDHIDNYLMTRKNLEFRMKEQGIDRSDIYDNTVDIAETCNVNIEIGKDYFPAFSKKFDSFDYLKDLAFDNLSQMGLDNPEYINRLEEELGVIRVLNFSDYILVIWDMVHYAHSKNILVGPGRGSVGGSLLAYILGITKIDPIKHDLLFWRFLNVDIEYNPGFAEIKSCD